MGVIFSCSPSFKYFSVYFLKIRMFLTIIVYHINIFLSSFHLLILASIHESHLFILNDQSNEYLLCFRYQTDTQIDITQSLTSVARKADMKTIHYSQSGKCKDRERGVQKRSQQALPEKAGQGEPPRRGDSGGGGGCLN